MGRINGSVSARSDSYSFYIDWSESSVNQSNNTSVVTATAYIYCSAHTAYENNLAQSLTIDGTTFNDVKNVNLSSGVTVALVNGSKTIAHSNDGTKSITISASCDLPYGSGWGPDWGSASGTVTLTQIPRQAKLNLKSIENIGIDSCMARYEYVSGQFYRIQYRLNNGNWIETSGNPTISINNLEYNKEYKIEVRGLSQDGTLVGEASNSLTFKTLDIAHATLESDEIDFPEPIKLTITNQANVSAKALIYLNNIVLKEVELNTGENTITFSEGEEKLVYKSFSENENNIDILVVTDNKYSDTAISQKIIFKGNFRSVYILSNKQKGQLWVTVNGQWKKAIMWTKIKKEDSSEWKKPI